MPGEPSKELLGHMDHELNLERTSGIEPDLANWWLTVLRNTKSASLKLSHTSPKKATLLDFLSTPISSPCLSETTKLFGQSFWHQNLPNGSQVAIIVVQ